MGEEDRKVCVRLRDRGSLLDLTRCLLRAKAGRRAFVHPRDKRKHRVTLRHPRPRILMRTTCLLCFCSARCLHLAPLPIRRPSKHSVHDQVGVTSVVDTIRAGAGFEVCCMKVGVRA